MPTYDYRCPSGHVFELFQRMSDAPPSACEVCGASPVERVLVPVAVHFKGSGFYSTDYGRGTKSEASKDGSGGSANGDSSSKEAEKKTPAAASSDSSSSGS
jgi:putative FmdB family regulatory protein